MTYPPRKLAYKDRFVWVIEETVETAVELSTAVLFPDMTTLVPLTVEWSQEMYTRILSAMMVGAELAYPETPQQVYYDFVRMVNSEMTCEQIIECLENDAEVATALQQWLEDNGYGTPGNPDIGTPGNPGVYDDNPLIIDGSVIEDCNNDKLFGAITQLIDFINRRLVDLFEVLESETNIVERSQIIAEAFPISDSIGVDSAAAGFDQAVEEVAEGYDAAFTEELEDEYRCDLFCLVKDTCELDFQTFADYFNSRIANTPPAAQFSEYIEWFITGDFVGTNIVDAAYSVVMSALAYGSSAMGVNIQRLMQSMVSALNDPNSDWITLCEDCNPEQFEPVIDHNTPCAVAGQSCGTIISNPSPNVWRIASTHRSEGNDEGATIADHLGRTFKITGATKVSGADITFSTRANPACATTSAAGLNLNNNIVNIIYVAPNTAVWEYEFTFELV